MALVQEEAIRELLQAQLHVCNHIDFSFARSMALKCAVELSIPDIIHDQGKPAVTLSDLATALDLPPEKKPYLGRLMRLLVQLGFFTTSSTLGLDGRSCGQDEAAYHLTSSSKLLVKTNKLSLAPLVLVEMDPNGTFPLQKLSTWFRHEDPHLTPFELAYGYNIWNYISKNLEVNDMFNKAMVGDSLLTITVFVSKCGGVLDGLRSLVDVGGGTGATAELIADAFPGIKCTVLDLPHVVASRENHQNVSTGIEFVGGDMFLSIPNADAVFLKGVLHSWSDEDCVKILRQCREAIPSKEKGGKVIIVEIVVGSKPDDTIFMETSLMADLMMMAYAGGKEREEQEWKKIFHDAGFSHYKVMHALGLRSVIEVYP